MAKWLIIALAISANTAAALLIKAATMPDRKLPSLSPLNLAFSNWPFWSGLAVYFVALISYIWALSIFPVTIAHPVITAGGIALVSFLAILIFSENFSFLWAIGFSCVLVGVIIIAIGSK